MGVAENIPVKVGEFIIAIDFVVMDMGNDESPLILGCPLLATSRAVIDIEQGCFTLHISPEEVTF